MNNYLRNNLAGYKIFLQQIIDNAIEWINADNYEDEEIELTEEEFAERIGIESVEVNQLRNLVVLSSLRNKFRMML